MTIPLGPLLSIDQPAGGVARAQPFTISGWAIDSSAGSGTGVDAVHVWAFPNPGSGAAPLFVGAAAYGAARTDVRSAYGSRFTNSGYSLKVAGLLPATYQLVAYSRSTAANAFNATRSVVLPIQNAPRMAVDTPKAGTVTSPLVIKGWAIDLASAAGTGVDAVHVWGYHNGGGAQFLGAASYGTARADVGTAFGSSRFSASGFALTLGALPSGTWDIVVYAHGSLSNSFDNWRVVRVTVP